MCSIQQQGSSLPTGFLGIFFNVLFFSCAALHANPTNGVVTKGTATIASQGNTLSIIQSSPTAIINWQSFSIGSGEITTFLQPTSNSAVLNRVLGGSISNLNGTLSANGRVYLINQNGIMIGAGGIINTASFLASTRDIADNDFLNGNLHFTGNGEGGVTNLGTIKALGGDVMLLGKTVENEGTITASATAALVSADDVLLTQKNNQGTQINVKPSTPATADRTGTAVTNGKRGTITATTAQLSAAQGNLFALAINNTGYVKARTLQHSGGHILLTSDSGTIQNSGTLDASADIPGGNGGKILVKSLTGDTLNTESGQILAKGGKGGKGGRIETSGQAVSLLGAVNAGHGGTWFIDPDDLIINAAAAATIDSSLNAGTNVTEQTTASTAIGSGIINPSGTGDIIVNSALNWTGTGTLTLMAYHAIRINASISGNAGGLTLDANGNITDTASLAVQNFVLLNGNWIQNAGGGLLPSFSVSNNFELQNNSTFLRVAGGNGSGANPYLITDVYGLEGIGSPSNALLGMSFLQTQNITADVTAAWNSGVGFYPIGLSSAFYGTYDGNGLTISGLNINRVEQSNVGLFGTCAAGADLKNIGLVGDSITGSNTVGALVASNFGLVQNCYATGSISGFYNLGGLVGINRGTVFDSYTTGSLVDGNSVSGLGGLVGSNIQGIVDNCYATGSVFCGNNSVNVGGLVGYSASDAIVRNSYATGAVQGNGSSTLGGLIGFNDVALVLNSYATGDVQSQIRSGGLIGFNNTGSIIEMSYATGSVSGQIEVGGLIGTNLGGITLCYALGNVSGNTNVGGLVGLNLSTTRASPSFVNASKLVANATGVTLPVNASTGLEASITDSFARGTVTGMLNVGGLVGCNSNGSIIQTTYATGQVSGSQHVGGLVGCNLLGQVSSSYWLQDATLNTNLGLLGIGYDQALAGGSNAGATPETFANLQLASTYDSTWDFTPGTGIWGVNGVDGNNMLINDGLPFFQNQHPGYKPNNLLNPVLANIIQQFIASQVPTQGVIPLPGNQPLYFSFDPATNTVILSDTPNSKTTGKGKEHENAIASGSSYKPADAHSGKRTVLVLPGSAIVSMIEGQLPGITLPPTFIHTTFKVILGPGVQQALEQALKHSNP